MGQRSDKANINPTGEHISSNLNKTSSLHLKKKEVGGGGVSVGREILKLDYTVTGGCVFIYRQLSARVR